MTKLAFIDCETTGLDPDRHEVWELGLILSEPDEDGVTAGAQQQYVWQFPVHLERADTIALNIGRFHDRRWPDIPRDEDAAVRVESVVMGMNQFVVPMDSMGYWARLFADLTRGAHLVGACVSFDADRLWRLLRFWDECPMWHYHIVDVEALAAGWLAAGHDWRMGTPSSDKCRPPWKSDELSLAVGVDPGTFNRHTALGDARWAMAIYDAVMGPQNRSK